MFEVVQEAEKRSKEVPRVEGIGEAAMVWYYTKPSKPIEDTLAVGVE